MVGREGGEGTAGALRLWVIDFSHNLSSVARGAGGGGAGREGRCLATQTKTTLPQYVAILRRSTFRRQWNFSKKNFSFEFEYKIIKTRV